MIRCDRGCCGNVATMIVAYAGVREDSGEPYVKAVRPVCDDCAPVGVQAFWRLPIGVSEAVDDPIWPDDDPERSRKDAQIKRLTARVEQLEDALRATRAPE